MGSLGGQGGRFLWGVLVVNPFDEQDCEEDEEKSKCKYWIQHCHHCAD